MDDTVEGESQKSKSTFLFLLRSLYWKIFFLAKLAKNAKSLQKIWTNGLTKTLCVAI